MRVSRAAREPLECFFVRVCTDAIRCRGCTPIGCVPELASRRVFTSETREARLSKKKVKPSNSHGLRSVLARHSCEQPLFPHYHARDIAVPGAGNTIGFVLAAQHISLRGTHCTRCQSVHGGCKRNGYRTVVHMKAVCLWDDPTSAYSEPGDPLAMAVGTWMVAAPKAAREIEIRRPNHLGC
jgi:hypothetical protein